MNVVIDAKTVILLMHIFCLTLRGGDYDRCGVSPVIYRL